MYGSRKFEKFKDWALWKGFAEKIEDIIAVKLISYQSKNLQEMVSRHIERFKRLEIINPGEGFKWEEFDKIFEIGEGLESEGFKLTLDIPLMRLGSPIYGGYIYVYDMGQRDKLLKLADELKKEIRILPGNPPERDEIENLFLDCLAVGLHYDYHAIWLWLRFKKLRKYQLLTPPDLVEYVLNAESAFLSKPIQNR